MNIYSVYEFTDKERGFGFLRDVSVVRADNIDEAREVFNKSYPIDPRTNSNMEFGIVEISESEFEILKVDAERKLKYLQKFIENINKLERGN